MPWVTYTHISHTNSRKKDNATPLFDWGKYYEMENNRVIGGRKIKDYNTLLVRTDE